MAPTLTIFAAPKAFVGAAETNQRNAVWSWTQLGPDVEVILIGDEEGIAEASRELGTRHVATVERSPAGVPLLSDVFRIGQGAASSDVCLFVNSDIVLGPDLLRAARAASMWAPQFLMIGQRWDTPIDECLAELGPDWWRQTRERAVTLGTLNSVLWIDYFAFRRGQYDELPPFVIGRPGYDNWLVWHTRKRAIPIIDASQDVTAVHQHHEYAQYGGTKIHIWSADGQTNEDLIGDRRKLFTVGHATHRLVDQQIKPARGMKYYAARVHHSSRPILDATRPVRQKVGLNSELVQRLTAPLRRRQQR